METLHEGALEFEQELAYAKARMQIHKELGEKLDDAEQVETTPEEQEVIEEEDAKSRLTFDPVSKIFDDRKRRVTDLQNCSQVTLPRPFPTKEETLIEMRREILHGSTRITGRKDARRMVSRGQI